MMSKMRNAIICAGSVLFGCGSANAAQFNQFFAIIGPYTGADFYVQNSHNDYNSLSIFSASKTSNNVLWYVTNKVSPTEAHGGMSGIETSILTAHHNAGGTEVYFGLAPFEDGRGLDHAAPLAGSLTFEAPRSLLYGRDSYLKGGAYDAGHGLTFYVQSVPEPATWALMLLGVGLTGAAMRRRKLQLA